MLKQEGKYSYCYNRDDDTNGRIWCSYGHSDGHIVTN